MNNETDTNITGPNTTSTISVLLVVICLYVIGLFLHAKIIIISKREKDMTWKLDVTNSVILIIHYTYAILMHTGTYIIQDLHTHTGKWFCHVSHAITYYGILYSVGHSLIISMMKYILIVYDEKIRDFGKDKVKEIFFWANLLHPIIWTALHLILKPDFDGFTPINRCLGNTQNNLRQGNNTSSIIDRFFLGDFYEPPHQNSSEYAIYIFKQVLSVLYTTSSYLMVINFFDMVLYCKIFSYMRR